MTLFVGTALLATAGWIVYNAIGTFGTPHKGAPLGLCSGWAARPGSDTAGQRHHRHGKGRRLSFCTVVNCMDGRVQLPVIR